MSRKLILPSRMILVVALLFGTLEFRGQTKPTISVDESGLALRGYDPVADFKEGKAVKGDVPERSVGKSPEG